MFTNKFGLGGKNLVFTYNDFVTTQSMQERGSESTTVLLMKKRLRNVVCYLSKVTQLISDRGTI